MAVTRADVARLAGTSPALVSYVLNGGPRRVAPATRARIEAAIAELGYRPNVSARSLRMNRGHALGMVIPDGANPFFAELAAGIELAAFARGYPLFIGNAAGDEERERAYVRSFIDRRVEGLLAISSSWGTGIADACEAAEMVLVAVDRVIDPRRCAHVLCDSVAGARAAVAHLVEHGHREIACLSGPHVSTAEDRVLGYRNALAEAGLPEGRIVRTDFGGAAGYHALSELLHGTPRPTAVFVTSDLQAMGMLRAAYDAGLRVPDDLAVIAFDGIEYARYTRPGLTTMTQPTRRMGELAVDLLLEQIDSHTSRPGVVRLSAELKTRGSCGCSDEF
ncbi:LacI family DNA-binding transcriptional regulator [Nocardia terpenica]|uniref:LacI family DNA-binding transcriptional regulator n=1 Tax=Nocardia terpenica TaxID=455432 RepID=UPI0018943E98|nr:LacI family DNA-binding transcriptional regulator [Nocardia terpenica]MBF6065905.1 LacI family DNA-binding transcriptional regulator [Nocardia terpenica]MBF6108899.1 LacI family DNA-binding transcriptional regulator [Nocardia terpenica]MBF6116149.1 LacI family DNA-binding transcriptional regulator [Nocardia terpenica]MBF6123150.1 LacI family DNA-binding transcriptional regulator [Nocardia terpenica]MBF6153168.1 LacI family DNA-binding transcriptional regulator [Nocardia terpenica]